jgi:hypothetical protein
MGVLHPRDGQVRLKRVLELAKFAVAKRGTRPEMINYSSMDVRWPLCIDSPEGLIRYSRGDKQSETYFDYHPFEGDEDLEVLAKKVERCGAANGQEIATQIRHAKMLRCKYICHVIVNDNILE